jgi:hypothetical protein
VSWADMSWSNFDLRCCITANHKMLHHNAHRVYIRSNSTCSICCGLIEKLWICCRTCCTTNPQQIEQVEFELQAYLSATFTDSDTRVEYSAENMSLEVLTVVGKSFHFSGRRCAYLRLRSLLFVFVNVIAYAWGN